MGFKKKKSRNYGHLNGLKTIEKVIRKTIDLKIAYLTLYTFSTENWRRPKSEINFLFFQLKSYFNKHINNLIKQGIKVSIIGERKNLPIDIKNVLKKVELKTINNNKLNLIVALNYGSKEEIISSIKKLIKKNKTPNTKNFESELYTKNIPNPEILIRTGFRKRLSNFLLWQIAYTEIFFVDKLWPDFTTSDYIKIINKYKKIKRNFGSI